MSYMNRIYMAVAVAAMKSHSDQGQKLKILNHAKKRFFSGPDAADLRPLSGLINSGVGGSVGGGADGNWNQTEESLRHAIMYMAAGMAVAKGHSDPAKMGIFTGGNGSDPANLRPSSGFIDSGVGGFLGGGEERRNRTEESLRQVMYFNCWGQV
ncbi:Unknown protein [Striga hermonthica]|uniref:Uncharacterized protein n=1 Tax=Striga hermonthica TaxID=68872 RepID=A0A9N7N8L7_STRHE|nr:Unknown protein [Striga hermonthica]